MRFALDSRVAEASNTAVRETPRTKRTAVTVAALVMAGMGTGWLLRGTVSPGRLSSAPTEARQESMVHLEPFVLNLADSRERAFLRVTIDLGIESDAQSNTAVPTALVRDTILNVLAVRNADDLLTSEGKSKLKADLVRTLRQRAPQLAVREAYFTEFLIQR